jgi:hypothetical protein
MDRQYYSIDKEEEEDGGGNDDDGAAFVACKTVKNEQVTTRKTEDLEH